MLLQSSAAQAMQSLQWHEAAIDSQQWLAQEELPSPNTTLFEEPPSRRPLQEEIPPLPPPEILLQFPEAPEVPTPSPELGGDRICITGFNVVGSTVYSAEELAQVAADAIPLEMPNCEVATPDPTPGYLLTFAQVQQARDAITQYYVDNQYITTGAFVPEQTLESGVVQLQVIEGRIEEIQVLGLDRLNPAYVRDRISLAAQSPLNTEQLLQGLQLLQLDPLIESLDVELATGIRPGTNRLIVNATEANPYRLGFILDNGRTPLVGSFQRRVRGGHINLLGQGDVFFVDYANTDGSNSVNLYYAYPLNARNGTLSFSHGRTSSWVIEEPFEILDIRSRSRYYELTYRQPVYQTPNQEFALSLTGSREESESRFNPGGFGDQPFIVRGSDNQGRTQITALRFTQEWLNRDSQQVLAVRSQFSLGINALGVTLNPAPPNGNFFSWRAQGQWVYLLGPDTLLQLRGDFQVADRPLVPLEQIGIGGVGTVRGYRQDQLLTDNGITASADVRFPIARVPEVNGLLQLIPFVDFGMGWNNTGENPNPSTLLSTGLGLNWQMEGGFSTRLDYGLPLVNAPTTGNSLQESGLVFSLRYEPF
ncbi:MAG TPA: ShlB/FhaC/HecB family hemolysin secretion/activation protein [Trichocoleus sp.]